MGIGDDWSSSASRREGDVEHDIEYFAIVDDRGTIDGETVEVEELCLRCSNKSYQDDDACESHCFVGCRVESGEKMVKLGMKVNPKASYY